jgi:hypothetical protein
MVYSYREYASRKTPPSSSGSKRLGSMCSMRSVRSVRGVGCDDIQPMVSTISKLLRKIKPPTCIERIEGTEAGQLVIRC